MFESIRNLRKILERGLDLWLGAGYIADVHDVLNGVKTFLSIFSRTRLNDFVRVSQ